MKTMTWAQRICIGSGLALASVFSVPAVASAATANCYTGCTPPTVANNSVVPPTTTPGTGTTSQTVSGSSSLPFTGADVSELAAVGIGAIVIGGVLVRRRRTA
ncbi:MAG: LPXTG cell wall anchor domain-containing protein [Acidimicrobiales bacterium]|jgi:LPXTG-motif cell wall-anchored protein